MRALARIGLKGSSEWIYLWRWHMHWFAFEDASGTVDVDRLASAQELTNSLETDLSRIVIWDRDRPAHELPVDLLDAAGGPRGPLAWSLETLRLTRRVAAGADASVAVQLGYHLSTAATAEADESPFPKSLARARFIWSLVLDNLSPSGAHFPEAAAIARQLREIEKAGALPSGCALPPDSKAFDQSLRELVGKVIAAGRRGQLD